MSELINEAVELIEEASTRMDSMVPSPEALDRVDAILVTLGNILREMRKELEDDSETA